MTMNKHWGYNRLDENWKSTATLVRNLVDITSKGGNFLLNIGPMPNGKIQPEFIDTLTKVGKWMEKNGESIYGTRGNAAAPQQWGVVTSKANTLYAHILSAPEQDYIFIPSLKQKIVKAAVLANGNSLKFKQQPEGVFVYVKGIETDPYDTIIKLSTN